MWRIGLFLLLLALPFRTTAQFSYVVDQSVAVTNHSGADALSLAWAGGINAAQHNTMDLNGDGTDDLVLFDRMANKVITFLNDDNSWRYQPEYEALFPSEITNFVLLRDFNCDGKKDLFTSDLLGIKVYVNVTAAGALLSWEPYLFTTPSGEKKTFILTYGSDPDFKINLQIQYDDLPALVDADNDGDLDIFNVQYMGHSVEYHQNFSVENGWGCDSLEFRRITDHWGDFRECACGVIALKGEPCPASGSRTMHAGGKALLAIDANGDQTLDLVFSEAECTDLTLLANEGTLLNPVINTYTTFPHPTPASYALFPAAFYEDVDFDGVKDLISSPNLFQRESPATNATNFSSSNWLFKNEGTDDNPAFALVKKNFLQDEMIDVGDNAVPAFADFDGDGDLDLFVSSYADPSLPELRSSIFHFENTGTSSRPSFQLVNTDYHPYDSPPLYNQKIAFTDLNGDGARDLVFTASISNGDGRTDNDPTRLYFIPNASTEGIVLDGQPLFELDFKLLSVENLSFADINADGKADILAGRNDGSIEYWRNGGGDELAPSFILESDPYMGLGPSFFRQNSICILSDLNGDGKEDLAYSDIEGRISIIPNYRSNVDAPHVTSILYNPLLSQHGEYNFGGLIWPVAANLFGMDKPAIAVGTRLGGIYMLRNQSAFGVFPSPLSPGEALHVQAEERATVFVYTASGKLVGGPVAVEGAREFDVSTLAPGLYILKFVTDRRSFTEKVVIR